MIEKDQIRKRILERRKLLNEMDLLSANEKIVGLARDIINSLVKEEQNKAPTLGIYWPLKGEPDLLKLAAACSGKVAIPKIRGDRMNFVKYDLGSYLEKSMYTGLMQPESNINVVPELIFVPGLSFCVSGYRLGFGKGYYDKYFRNHPNITKVGVCFHESLVETLPYNLNDIRMDYILTDKAIIVL